MTDTVKSKMPVPTHMSAQEITDFYEGHIAKAMTVADAGEKYLALDKVAKHLAMHGKANADKVDDVITGAKFLTAVGGVLLLAAAAGGLLLAAPAVAAAVAATSTAVIAVGVPTLVAASALMFTKIQNKLFPWVKNKYASAEVANNAILIGLFGKVRKAMDVIAKQTSAEELQKSPVAGVLSKMKAFAMTGAFKSASNPDNDNNAPQSNMKVTPPTL